ncbi:hypothetical protein LTR49_028839, partial [Elasticomyces elasticus]
MIYYHPGAPAGGKGTLCQRWCTEFEFAHLSVGNLLRRLVKAKDRTLPQRVINRVLQCELLDTDDLLSILEDAVASLHANGYRNIVIDGFPRTFEQAKAAEDSIGTPRLVLSFEYPRDIAKNRYMSRSHSGRDADPAIFDKRYEEFGWLNSLVVEGYEKRALLVK